MGTRLVSVGDSNQMLYSFAGGDPDSFNALKSIPNTECLPLSISYRCPKNVVEFAKKLVPSIEANEANTIIRTIILNSYSDQILDLYHRLYYQGYVTNFVPIKNDEDEVICYKMICKSMFNHNLKDYALIWHGTEFKNLESIVKNGLKPSGTKISDKTIIMPRINHIQLNTTVEGNKDWAKAVFASPSCFFSSHPIYAETILSNGRKWACLVEGRVKNGCFTRHHSTIEARNVPYNEPSDVEFRITNLLNLFVTSVVFISMDFINHASYYDEQDAITETSQERMLTEESYWSENI